MDFQISIDSVLPVEVEHEFSLDLWSLPIDETLRKEKKSLMKMTYSTLRNEPKWDQSTYTLCVFQCLKFGYKSQN